MSSSVPKSFGRHRKLPDSRDGLVGDALKKGPEYVPCRKPSDEVRVSSDDNMGPANACGGLLPLDRRGAAGARITERSKSTVQQCATAIACIDNKFLLSHRSCLAFRLLLDAYHYARQLGRCDWDFAEEIATLRQYGLSNSDLRWLVCHDYVEHGREITKFGEDVRKFHHEGGLRFSEETCFVLTEAGASYVSRSLQQSINNGAGPWMQVSRETPDEPDLLQTPTWDRDRQELRVGRTIVKQYKVPAPNQEIILAVFQEENWPVYIDDPLPPHPEIDPKRRLHDTINSLNRNQKNHLIQFRGNGSGEGVRWEFFQAAESSG